MTKVLPYMLKVKSGRFVPIDWDDYAYLISLGFNLSLKWIIARNLLELVRLHSNPSECPAFERLWEGVDQHGMIVRQQMFAMQAIAATMDLTENFAAMCFAYAEAVKNGSKFLPLLLRDFGNLKEKHYLDSGVRKDLGTAKALFDTMLNSGNVLREYLACQDEPADSLIKKRNIIKKIVEFRKKYETWYNKFKHTNSVLAVGALFDVPEILSSLHRVPDHLKWSDENVTFKDERLFESIKTDESAVLGIKVSRLQTDSMLTAYQNLDDVALILGLLKDPFWQPIRAHQHKSLFGRDLES